MIIVIEMIIIKAWQHLTNLAAYVENWPKRISAAGCREEAITVSYALYKSESRCMRLK